MKRMGRRGDVFGLGAVIAVAGVSVCAGPAFGHEGDLFVGRTGEGRLTVEFDFDDVIPLAAVNGLLAGYAADEPGFAVLDKDEPKEDFYMLADGVEVVFEMISIDAALKAWLPGLNGPLVAPGATWTIGGNEFDEHLTWHIDSADPGFDSEQAVWQLSFRLIDQGPTGYAPSEIYTARFAPVPEPGTLVLLAAVGAAGLTHGKRRTRR